MADKTKTVGDEYMDLQMQIADLLVPTQMKAFAKKITPGGDELWEQLQEGLISLGEFFQQLEVHVRVNVNRTID